jgi:tetratricopeptide (TPR) repeat protein
VEESLKDFQGINDLYWESVSSRWLGNMLEHRGDIQSEENYYHHLELARKAGERQNLAEALSNWAYHLFASNRLDETARYVEEASMLARQIGITLEDVNTLFAEMAWLKGNTREAGEILKEMRERCYALGDRNYGAVTSADLGLLALQEGDFYQAHIYLEEALAIAREIGSKSSTAYRLAELGNTFFIEGRMQEFKQNYRESFLLGRGLGVVVKRNLLRWALDSINPQKPEISAQILGAIYHSAPPTHPLSKRPYDRAKAYARQVLGDALFESAFEEGQKISLDQALELAWKIVDEM